LGGDNARGPQRAQAPRHPASDPVAALSRLRLAHRRHSGDWLSRLLDLYAANRHRSRPHQVEQDQVVRLGIDRRQRLYQQSRQPRLGNWSEQSGGIRCLSAFSVSSCW
jgi:hypothetical protein